MTHISDACLRYFPDEKAFRACSFVRIHSRMNRFCVKMNWPKVTRKRKRVLSDEMIQTMRPNKVHDPEHYVTYPNNFKKILFFQKFQKRIKIDKVQVKLYYVIQVVGS